MSTGRRLSRPSTKGGKHGRVQTSARSHKAVAVHEERRLDTILVYLRSPEHEEKQRLEEVHAIIGARKMRGVWSSCPGDDEVKRKDEAGAKIDEVADSVLRAGLPRQGIPVHVHPGEQGLCGQIACRPQQQWLVLRIVLWRFQWR